MTDFEKAMQGLVEAFKPKPIRVKPPPSLRPDVSRFLAKADAIRREHKIKWIT